MRLSLEIFVLTRDTDSFTIFAFFDLLLFQILMLDQNIRVRASQHGLIFFRVQLKWLLVSIEEGLQLFKVGGVKSLLRRFSRFQCAPCARV